jgi:hypothetical protein
VIFDQSMGGSPSSTRIRLPGGSVQLTARIRRKNCSYTGASQVMAGDWVVLRQTGRRSVSATGWPSRTNLSIVS